MEPSSATMAPQCRKSPRIHARSPSLPQEGRKCRRRLAPGARNPEWSRLRNAKRARTKDSLPPSSTRRAECRTLICKVSLQSSRSTRGTCHKAGIDRTPRVHQLAEEAVRAQKTPIQPARRPPSGRQGEQPPEQKLSQQNCVSVVSNQGLL